MDEADKKQISTLLQSGRSNSEICLLYTSLKDGSDYEGPFPILTGQTIDLDTIQAIDYYRDNPLVQKAVKELAAACLLYTSRCV